MTDRSRRYDASTFQPNTFPDSPRSVYASAPFKFIVGGEPLYIHADLVSLHSKPLGRMINGPMAEAQNGFATLEDIDEGTFVRFIEWAHKGYYTAGEFTIAVEEGPDPAGLGTDDDHGPKSDKAPILEELDQPSPSGQIYLDEYGEPVLAAAAAAEPPVVNDEWDSWRGDMNSLKKGKSKTKMMFGSISPPRRQHPLAREDLRQNFISRKSVIRKSAIGISSPRRNQDSAEIYSDIFLSHARLYVFAEKYDIQPLKMLALDELHLTLAHFNLYVERTGDIIDLLQFIYANTGESRGGVEDLRTLMTQYVVYEMDMLMKDKCFRDIMLDRDFFDDFLKMVAKRISPNVTT